MAKVAPESPTPEADHKPSESGTDCAAIETDNSVLAEPDKCDSDRQSADVSTCCRHVSTCCKSLACSLCFCAAALIATVAYYAIYIEQVRICIDTSALTLTNSTHVSNPINFIATHTSTVDWTEYDSETSVSQISTPEDCIHPASAAGGGTVPRCDVQIPIVWDASETAVLLIDVWDSFFCPKITQRIEELAIKLNDTLTAMRKMGITVVHVPFGTTDYYKTHAARVRTTNLVGSAWKPVFASWRQYYPFREPAPRSFEQDCTLPGPSRQSRHIFIDPTLDYMVLENSFIDPTLGNSFWETKTLFEVLGIKKLFYAGASDSKCVLDRHNGLLEMIDNGYEGVLLHNHSVTSYEPSGAWSNVSYGLAHEAQMTFIQKCVASTTDNVNNGGQHISV